MLVNVDMQLALASVGLFSTIGFWCQVLIMPVLWLMLVQSSTQATHTLNHSHAHWQCNNHHEQHLKFARLLTDAALVGTHGTSTHESQHAGSDAQTRAHTLTGGTGLEQRRAQ